MIFVISNKDRHIIVNQDNQISSHADDICRVFYDADDADIFLKNLLENHPFYKLYDLRVERIFSL